MTEPYNKDNLSCLFTQDDWKVWENIDKRSGAKGTRRKAEVPIPARKSPREIWRDRLTDLLMKDKFDEFIYEVQKYWLDRTYDGTYKLLGQCPLCDEIKEGVLLAGVMYHLKHRHGFPDQELSRLYNFLHWDEKEARRRLKESE